MNIFNLDSVPTDEIPEPPQRLSEEFPEEVRFFCRRFIWSSNKAGFYTREKYFGTEERKPWLPFKRGDGTWQHFYANLVVELAEKHVDFERFCHTHPPKSQVRAKDHETAFWLGTMAGDRTWNDCLDVDSHDVIGYCAVPSRQHVSKCPSHPLAQLAYSGDYQWRLVPVVKMGLAHFQLLKKVHSVFINRIWAFSSANLGFGLWRIYPQPKRTADRHDILRRQLATVGLEHIEVYPRPPKSKTSLGKCHRRPCGMDSAIITEDGLTTDPIEQIRLFMRPPPTPSFEMICDIILKKLEEMYCNWIAWDDVEPATVISKDKRITKSQRPEIAATLRADLEIVKDWLHSGCPMPSAAVAIPSSPNEENMPVVESESHLVDGDTTVNSDAPGDNNQISAANNTGLLPCGEQSTTPSDSSADNDLRTFPDYFHNVDLKTINRNQKWVQFCLFLAHHGFPCHDHFLEVVSTLAKWLAFYECYDLLPDRTHIKELLRTFCLSKNNGYITRLEEGRVNEVLDNVDRIVDDVIDGEDDEGKRIFEEMRMKRDSGQYPEVYEIEALMGSSEAASSYTVSLSGPILCGSLGWTYACDNTPLPENMSNSIMEVFCDIGSPLRRNKEGNYPTMLTIARLVNYLYSRPKKGRGRISRQLFEKMGFPSSSPKRERIKKVLQKAGVIDAGSYQSKRQSREYWLTTMALEILDEERLV